MAAEDISMKSLPQALSPTAWKIVSAGLVTAVHCGCAARHLYQWRKIQEGDTCRFEISLPGPSIDHGVTVVTASGSGKAETPSERPRGILTGPQVQDR